MSAHLPFPDRAVHVVGSARPHEETNEVSEPRLRRSAVFNAIAILGYALVPLFNGWLNNHPDNDFALVIPFSLEVTRELLDALAIVWWPLMLFNFISLLFATITYGHSRYTGYAPRSLEQLAAMLGVATVAMTVISLGSLAVAGGMMLLSFVAVLISVLVVLLLVGFAWGAVFLIRLLFAF